MTANELQRIVVNLSNQMFVRYWLNFNHASGEVQVQMAISCRDHANSLKVRGLEELGFRRLERNKLIYYVVDRTNDDNTPYYSALG